MLLILLLAIWWWVLLNPLLFLLQGAGGFALDAVYGSGSRDVATVSPSGDWNFTIPLEATMRNAPDHPGLSQIHSIEFTVPRADMLAFTFSLPVFWAIVLAAGGIRKNLRALVWGTLLMAIVEIVLLLVFAKVTAHQTAGQLSEIQSDFTRWLLRVTNYLVSNVIPFLAPFLVAIALHPELRAQIANWDPPGAREPEPPRKTKPRDKGNVRSARPT
jgi:hypothetical protein